VTDRRSDRRSDRIYHG